MKVINGAELFDSLTQIDRGLREIQTVARRAGLPKWKQILITISEKIIRWADPETFSQTPLFTPQVPSPLPPADQQVR